MTKLADRAAARPASAPPGAATRLSDRVFAGRGERTEIPGLGPVYVRLAGERETLEIEAQVFAVMKALDLPIDVLTAASAEAVRAALTLAIAVREVDNLDAAFGTAEEWRSLDIDLINAAWQVYGDVRLRLDPVSRPCTDEEIAAVEAAVAKKNSTLLRSFGVVTLATFLASMADRPSTSLPPRSGPGAESPAGSG